MRPAARTFNLPPAAPALALGLALALGGCSIFESPRELRGNRLHPDQLREITPGVATRGDVAALVGSPTVTPAFGDDRWYYVSGVSRLRPGREPTVEDQRVVEVSFDERGVVRAVRELPPADPRSVRLVERETPVPGNDRTLLQALFGNIGRFGVPGGPAAETSPGPGAPR